MQINDKCCVVAMSQRPMQYYSIKWDHRFLVQIHLDISQVFNQILRKSTKENANNGLFPFTLRGCVTVSGTFHNI